MRTQPVCQGVSKSGELRWGQVPMARWQMAMFPVHYRGDFRNHWIKLIHYYQTGQEIDLPSMELRFTPWKTEPKVYSGD